MVNEIVKEHVMLHYWKNFGMKLLLCILIRFSVQHIFRFKR